MPFNVNDFKARIGGRLASPANFRVLFSGAILKGGSDRMLALLCNSTQLPGRSLDTNEYTTHGPIRKYPYQNVYDDVTFSFYCEESMGVSELFHEWHSFICDNNTTNEFSYYEDYVSDMIIEQFDAAGNITRSVKLIDAYPVMVSPLDLSWSSQNEFLNLQVTFTFKYWREEPVLNKPFGNYLEVNSLFPNFDISGALSQFGAAVFSRVDGQFFDRAKQSIRFGKKINNALSERQNPV